MTLGKCIRLHDVYKPARFLEYSANTSSLIAVFEIRLVVLERKMGCFFKLHVHKSPFGLRCLSLFIISLKILSLDVDVDVPTLNPPNFLYVCLLVQSGAKLAYFHWEGVLEVLPATFDIPLQKLHL